MSVLSREGGASRLKVFLWILALFVVVHIGIKLVPMYMDFWRMDDEIRIKAGSAQVLKDDEILNSLVTKAKDLDLPLGPQNFVIIRDEERHVMRIRTAWDVEVHFFWGVCGKPCVKTYHFQPSAEGAY